MIHPLLLVPLIVVVASALLFSFVFSKRSQNNLFINEKKLANTLGVKGTLHAQDYKINVSFAQLKSFVDGFELTAAIGLEFELHIMPSAHSLLLMAEVALFESEILTLEQVLINHGAFITAVHNHFVRENPKIIFLHFQAFGTEEQLGTLGRAVITTLKHLRSALEVLETINPRLTDRFIKIINNRLPQKGTLHEGAVYKIKFKQPPFALTDHGTVMSASSWVTFQGTVTQAATAGEFALTTEQVELFTQTLINNNIEVVAIHNHMLFEEPRIIFVHTWATGSLEALVHGIAEALTTLNL